MKTRKKQGQGKPVRMVCARQREFRAILKCLRDVNALLGQLVKQTVKLVDS